LEDFHSSQIDLRPVTYSDFERDDQENRTVARPRLWTTGALASDPRDFTAELVEEAATDHLVAILEEPRVKAGCYSDVFNRVWSEHMPSAVIPYDLEARRERFSEAYRELAPQIEKWECLKALGPGRIREIFARRHSTIERL